MRLLPLTVFQNLSRKSRIILVMGFMLQRFCNGPTLKKSMPPDLCSVTAATEIVRNDINYSQYRILAKCSELVALELYIVEVFLNTWAYLTTVSFFCMRILN